MNETEGRYNPSVHKSPNPRRTSSVVAVVPVFPPLYFLAFYSLRFLRRWNRLAYFIFSAFLGSQLVAAVFTPHPGISLGLAMARGLFILALITTGAWFGSAKRLYPLLLGLAVVYITALLTSFLTYGPDIFNLRLKHPYYTEVSLGLSGAVGLLLVATWDSGNRWLRLGFGALALIVMALAGSRSALGALLVGALGGAFVGYRRLIPVVFSGLGLLSLAALFSRESLSARAIERFLFLGLNGRDRFWKDAWDTFLAHPWGGVGPYQLGPYLKSLYWGQCQLWPILERHGLQCPGWLQPFSGAWIIAHNILLHQLGETGIVGTIGLLGLLGFIAYAVWKTRDPLLTAIFLAFMVMGLTDVPTAVPSLHLAEFFWVAMGIALAKAGFFKHNSVGSAADDYSKGGAGQNVKVQPD